MGQVGLNNLTFQEVAAMNKLKHMTYSEYRQ